MSISNLTKSLALLACFGLTACDKPAETAAPTKETVEIQHVNGSTSVAKNPKNIVVFDIASLEALQLLDIDVAGLPKTSVHLPAFLQQYKDEKYFDAGTLFEPNFEAISNAKPDLIITSGRSDKAYAQLNEIAPALNLAIDQKNFMPSLQQRTLQLASIFDKQAEAQAQLDQLNQSITEVKSQAEQAGTALMVMVTGGKISAYTPNSRFGFIYDALGFKPALEFKETGGHGNILSPELLLQANPDWLFVIDRDAAIQRENGIAAAQVLDNPLINKINAMQNNRVVYLDSNALYISGGLITYQNLVADIKKALAAQQ